jgi:hypothetical protein
LSEFFVRRGAKSGRTRRFGEALQRAFGAPPLTVFASLSCFALRLKPRKTGNKAWRKIRQKMGVER